MSRFNDNKDPDSIAEAFTIDWSADMALSSPADTIASSTWTASGGVTIVTSSNTTTTATVKVSGGQKGRYALLTNHAVFASGYEDDATITLDIKTK